MAKDLNVYVVAFDNGYEGFSEPMAAFQTEELALIYLAGASAAYRTARIFPLKLECVPDKTGDDPAFYRGVSR